MVLDILGGSSPSSIWWLFGFDAWTITANGSDAENKQTSQRSFTESLIMLWKEIHPQQKCYNSERIITAKFQVLMAARMTVTL
jgi:hypothetical protein